MAQALRFRMGGYRSPPIPRIFFIMHYEDQARRFNLLSGLLSGTLVGVGVGLIAAPLRSPPRAKNRRKKLRKRVAGGLSVPRLWSR